MEKEVWRDIPGFEGYQASNLGRIKSFKLQKNGRILKQSKRKNLSGYLGVQLFFENGKRDRKVHRLVCLAFHDNPENKPTVNHIDGNHENNCADNLEWATYAEQNKHAYGTGLRKPSKLNGGRKVVQILPDGKEIVYPSVRQASLVVGVSDTAIHKVCKELRHTAGGFRWKFID